jgi:hypothetical protein
LIAKPVETVECCHPLICANTQLLHMYVTI